MNAQDMIRKAQADGLVISKEYLKYAQEQYQTLSIHAPSLWKVVMSHRYILPNRIQGDYVNQELCDNLFLDFLLSYSTGIFPNDDDVTHVHYMDVIRALEFERPTYYVERSLAEALVRTDVPLDLQVDDIHWIYPQLRIYIPNNLLAITRNNQQNPAMFIDICKLDGKKVYTMPKLLEKEIRNIGGFYFPEHASPGDAFILNTMLTMDCSESNINYATTYPWGTSLREMIDIGNTHNLQSTMANDELDHAFMARVLCFAINVMLRLSSLPQAAMDSLRELRPIRKPKQEGKRSIVGLYPARIIGMDEIAKPTRPHEPSEPGKHLVAHWRRGHWRRQAYGPKAGLRRFQWIAPYHVGT